MNFKKLGLTLSGGGGKGAYQIGVWKALRDFQQLDQQIAAISGSSVGGLNGALIAQGKYEKAESMWLNIESHNMLTLQDIDWIGSRLGSLGASGVISPMLMGFLKTKGLFKRDGLQSMIDQGLDADLLANSTAPLTVGLHHASDNRVVYQPIREARIANDALLATAALPGIFDDVSIDGATYSDGGFYWGLPHKRVDNTPVQPLVDAGCDTVIVVCLSQDDLSVTASQYPGVRVLPIIPSRDLGGLTATLDFSNDGAARRMEQGYADATQLLQYLELYISNEDQYQALWQRVAASAQAEEKIRTGLHQVDQKHTKTVRDAVDFDRTIATDDFTQAIHLVDDDDLPGGLSVLALDNSNLLADLERQQIQTAVEGFLTQNQNNRQVVERTVLDALAALSPVQGRAAHLKDQGLLQRVWGGITGSNQKLAAENDHALAQAQFASLRLIAAVQEKGAITLEFTCALQNRLNGAFHEIERLGQRHNQDLRRVYRSLAGVYTQLRNRLIQHEGRLSALERQGRLHHWLLHPNQIRQQGHTLSDLPVPLRLACLANDFFRLTQGQWQVDELVSLKEMCINVGLTDANPVSVRDFCVSLQHNDATRAALLDLLAAEQISAAPRHTAAGWLSDLRENALPPDADATQALARWQYPADTPLPAWDFLAEVLYHLQSARFVPVQHSELGQLKADWAQKLNALSQLVQEDILPKSFAPRIAAVQEHITGFKLAVPLVGQFSVGKSTLLNTWLGADIQQEDLSPCTGVATEFHYAPAGQEKLVIHRQTPGADQLERTEYPRSAYANMRAELGRASSNVLFIELHCNLPALSRHPDLVLVDTPGLGSNNNLHDQALSHYLGEGVVFILCITRHSQVGKEELAFVNRQRDFGQSFSVLVCQEDLNNASQCQTMRDTAQKQVALDSDQLIRGCSARENNLTGFNDILANIEKNKAELLRARMVPEVQALVEEAERLIKNQLASDTSADELAAKKAAIHKSMAKLKESYAEEEAQLLADCRGSITRQIQATVGSFLRGRLPNYASQLLARQDIGPTLVADAKNAFQLATDQSLTPRLKDAAKALGKHAPLGSIGPVDIHGGGVGLDAENNGLGGAGAGAAAGAAIGSFVPLIGTLVGGVIGGIIGFFASRTNQKAEAEAQADQAIESTIAQINSKTGAILETEAQKILAAVFQQVEAQVKTEEENIAKIEQQLLANADQKNAMEARVTSALETVKTFLL